MTSGKSPKNLCLVSSHLTGSIYLPRSRETLKQNKKSYQIIFKWKGNVNALTSTVMGEDFLLSISMWTICQAGADLLA